MVFGGQDGKKEERGKGEGGRRREEEREDRVFLTFRMVKGRASDAPARMRHDLGQVTFVLQWSNFVHDVASKMYVFQLKDNIFHQIGPSCWQGPKM